jgi:hypothetical protein
LRRFVSAVYDPRTGLTVMWGLVCSLYCSLMITRSRTLGRLLISRRVAPDLLFDYRQIRFIQSTIFWPYISLHCPRLMDGLHQYMSVNEGTPLEARLLDDPSPWLIKQLSGAVQRHQIAKSFSATRQPADSPWRISIIPQCSHNRRRSQDHPLKRAGKDRIPKDSEKPK